MLILEKDGDGPRNGFKKTRRGESGFLHGLHPEHNLTLPLVLDTSKTATQPSHLVPILLLSDIPNVAPIGDF
jgi:hypothetical protein